MTEWQTQLEANYPLIVLLVGAFAAGVWIIHSIFKRRGDKPKARLIVEDAPTLCACGAIATHAKPYLEWSRTGIGARIRQLYGAPPRFERKVNNMREPKVCEAHSRAADTALDAKLSEVRNRYAEMNQKTIVELIQFENEGLDAKIAESFTKAQQRAKSNVTRLVQKNGTDTTEMS